MATVVFCLCILVAALAITGIYARIDALEVADKLDERISDLEKRVTTLYKII